MIALPPPFSLVALDRIDSTNDEARRAAERGAIHGTVISAAEQTAGRGRRGRSWISPPGNLHCSILLHCGPQPGLAPQLAFVAAVALRESLAELAPASLFQVKWPNDVLCGGRKIAGMLLEPALPLIILGVGVDVVEAPKDVLYPATCLRRAGSDAEALDVLAGFCGYLGVWYERWVNEGFAPIRQAWLAHAIGVGTEVHVKVGEDTVRQGRFLGIDQAGGLILEEAGGRQSIILAGDVFPGTG
jgi:BirA family transcriptional regulator, biotin operon repressor / biotin---[acetyl-CoA-carboxylase] ligase